MSQPMTTLPCGVLRRFALFAVFVWAGATTSSVAASDVLRVMLEEPVGGEIHGGVGNLRGWAVASEGIEKVEIWIDGAYAFDAPYGGARSDVAEAFPDVDGSDKSGFSLAYGYVDLTSGSHTISAVAHTVTGETEESAANFTVVKFKGEFISGPNAVDLSNTSCEASGDEISASNALIGGDAYDMVLDWRTAEQGFEVVDISEFVDESGATGPADSGNAGEFWTPPDNVEWIPFDFNGSGDKFCEDIDGFCAGWLETASRECRDNYKLGDSPEDTQSRRDYGSCAYDMVFRPYISIETSRTTSALSQAQKDTAKRLRESGWDQPSDQPVTFRTASDIPEPILEASKEGMVAAIDRLGNYGPLRVYLVGNDLAAAEELAEDFCEFNYPADYKERCLEDQGEAIREMAYIYPGGNGFQQSSWTLEQPVQSFVHNPYADENNQHNTAETDLINDKRVNAHEYFHVYQAAHKVYRGDYGFGWSTTRWVEEGAAIYFEQVMAKRMSWQDSVLLDNRVREDLNSMKSFTNRFPGVSIRDVDSEARTERLYSYCGQQCIGKLQYEFGHIAFKYLEGKVSQQKILFDYWDAQTEYGWADAFGLVFDQSLTDFYTEFEAFLLLSVDEQLVELGISP